MKKLLKWFGISFGILLAVSIIVAIFLPEESSEVDDQDIQKINNFNVEPGLGELGARFNMNLETYTDNFNNIMDNKILHLDNWEYGVQTSMQGTEEMFEHYFYRLSDTILLRVVVESSTGKINSVYIEGPFENGSESEVNTLIELMNGTFCALTGIDTEVGFDVIYEVSTTTYTTCMVYENICMKFTTDLGDGTVFMIVPVSEDVLATMEYTNIE